MGFRKITDKRWGFLIDALNDGGLYRMESVPKDKIKLAEKIYATSAASPQTKYDQQQKRLKRLNEKLIDFFNDKFKLQMPKDFKLYERLSSDPPGQYRFKFSVIKGSLTQYEDEFKAYDKAQLIDEGVSLYKKLQKTPTTDQDALIKN